MTDPSKNGGVLNPYQNPRGFMDSREGSGYPPPRGDGNPSPFHPRPPGGADGYAHGRDPPLTANTWVRVSGNGLVTYLDEMYPLRVGESGGYMPPPGGLDYTGRSPNTIDRNGPPPYDGRYPDRKYPEKGWMMPAKDWDLMNNRFPDKGGYYPPGDRNPIGQDRFPMRPPYPADPYPPKGDPGYPNKGYVHVRPDDAYRPQGYPNRPSNQPNYQHGYPEQRPGYPNQRPDYPNQRPDYPNPQPGYPHQQPGYPNQRPGYPNQQPEYPNQQPGYPNQQPGHPNQQHGYPNQQGGYNTQPGFYSPGNNGYDNRAPGGDSYHIHGGYETNNYPGGSRPGDGYNQGGNSPLYPAPYIPVLNRPSDKTPDNSKPDNGNYFQGTTKSYLHDREDSNKDNDTAGTEKGTSPPSDTETNVSTSATNESPAENSETSKPGSSST